jgi:hypothetical protein
MKFAVLVSFLAVSCATFGPPAFDIGVCASSRIVTEVPAIKAEVLADLASQNYAALLEDMGKRLGTDLVICAVREYTGVGAGSAGDPVVRDHAQQYLKAHGI